MGIEGSVLVHFTVNERGEVADVKIIRAEPAGIFEESVLSCVSAWRFKRPTVKGKAVRAVCEQSIEFGSD
jgi:protein TonB